MKILLANYRYFVSGGPERYMFNVTDALTARGHEVVPFSINYSRNLQTPYARYFVEPLGSRDEVYYQDQRRNLRTLWRTLRRLFYAPDVERAVMQLAQDTQPQVAYVLQYLRKLSPALLVGLKRAGLPIVVRLSDYGMLCPASICWRDGQPCELCVHGDLMPSIRYRCVQRSLVASTLNAVATWFHRYKRYFDLIDVFVTTTQFMYQMMLSVGFAQEWLRCIPTFVDDKVFFPNQNDSKSTSRRFAFVGRLDYDKGIHILLDAWRLVKGSDVGNAARLQVVGEGSDDSYVEHLRSTAPADVQFLGRLDTVATSQLLCDAFVSIVPSLWYDNLPNSVLESYASGTPVIASDTGSFKECVIEGETGYRFEPRNADHLAKKIIFCLEHPAQVFMMAENARQVALTKYSLERHLVDLQMLFDDLVGAI